MKNILLIVIVLVVAVFGYKYLQPNSAASDSALNTGAGTTVNTATESVEAPIEFDDITPTYVDLSADKSSATAIAPAPAPATTASFSCDGRQHCSQMSSCAEASFFNNSCPNTKMDGNNDGVPCEQQWC